MNIRTFLTAMAATVFLTFSTAQAQLTPEEFVVSLMADAQQLSSLNAADREQALSILVRNRFNIPVIGKFVLGRYWRRISPPQRQEFLEVFELAAVRTFSPMLANIPLDSFRVVRTNNKDINNVKVWSTINLKGNIIKINWRLRKEYSRDGYKIIDITAEGVSLIVTLRSEYTSYIKNNGGIPGLIATLKQKLEN